MPISMYDASVPVYTQMLGALDKVLAKAEAYAQARKIDPKVLGQARLFPDMLPLVSQVRIACDTAKLGLARITGLEAPKYEDNEKTLEELKARVAKTIDWLQGIQAAQLEGAENRHIVIPLRTRTLEMDGLPFLQKWALPNFYFHLTTAYALLRHVGVEIGKQDYLGSV